MFRQTCIRTLNTVVTLVSLTLLMVSPLSFLRTDRPRLLLNFNWRPRPRPGVAVGDFSLGFDLLLSGTQRGVSIGWGVPLLGVLAKRSLPFWGLSLSINIKSIYIYISLSIYIYMYINIRAPDFWKLSKEGTLRSCHSYHVLCRSLEY